MTNIRPPENILKIIDEMDRENDRAVALIGASLVEHGLVEVLNTKLIPDADIKLLFSERGPLSSIFAMNLMAYSLGIIGSKLKRDIDLIKDIRNEFAHNPNSVSFKDTSKISNKCRELQISKTSIPHDNADWRHKFFLEIMLVSAALMLYASKDEIPAAEEAARELAFILTSSYQPET